VQAPSFFWNRMDCAVAPVSRHNDYRKGARESMSTASSKVEFAGHNEPVRAAILCTGHRIRC